MDINTIVLIVILGVLLYAMVNNNQEKRLNAKKQKERMVAEKVEIANDKLRHMDKSKNAKNSYWI